MVSEPEIALSTAKKRQARQAALMVEPGRIRVGFE
jgi:hypothetical protein